MQGLVESVRPADLPAGSLIIFITCQNSQYQLLRTKQGPNSVLAEGGRFKQPTAVRVDGWSPVITIGDEVILSHSRQLSPVVTSRVRAIAVVPAEAA